MRLQKLGSWQSLILGALGVCAMSVGCKDDDPCDPGQIVQNSQCYPAPVGGGETGGSDAGGEPDTAGGAPSGDLNTPFGAACEDTTASSDCGGEAPLCADLTQLGQSVMCTQRDCSAGEENAGVCPAGFTCFAFPGYPSVCTKG
jgi:hypothetical protein